MLFLLSKEKTHQKNIIACIYSTVTQKFPCGEKKVFLSSPPRKSLFFVLFLGCGNDPSAGSPTETLLRLHLPLNDEI